MKRFLLICFSVLSLSMATFTVARADEDADARRYLLDLAAKVQQLQNQMSTLLNHNIQLNQQIANLQQTILSLQGEVQVLKHQLRIKDGNDQDIYQNGNVQIPQVADPQVQAAFNDSLIKLNSSQFATARDGFTQFAQQNPTSPLAPYAVFYAASSQVALKDYNGALANLNRLLQYFPKSERVPDTLFLKGFCLWKLNRIQDARAAMQTLIDDFPNLPIADKARRQMNLLK